VVSEIIIRHERTDELLGAKHCVVNRFFRTFRQIDFKALMPCSRRKHDFFISVCSFDSFLYWCLANGNHSRYALEFGPESPLSVISALCSHLVSKGWTPKGKLVLIICESLYVLIMLYPVVLLSAVANMTQHDSL
jgi:hypothetical protein